MFTAHNLDELPQTVDDTTPTGVPELPTTNWLLVVAVAPLPIMIELLKLPVTVLTPKAML
jgi:hypothetical protein